MFLLIELAIWALICLVFVSYEKGVAAFVATAIGAGVLAFTGLNVFTWAWANPVLVIQGALVYAVVGLVWAMLKWSNKLRKARRSYVKAKTEFVERGHGNEASFIERVKTDHWDRERYAPTVNKNKANLGFWCVWWPFSVINFFLEDFIREMWNFAWRFLKSFFERMRIKVLGEAARDLD